MANPNKVYNSIPKLWALRKEIVVDTRAIAEKAKSDLEQAGYPRVTIHPFKTGPRTATVMQYVVRAYIRK